MALELYAHPFSSYCQKVLIALYQSALDFQYRNLEAPGTAEALAALWPIGRFPVLVDDGRPVFEATIIVEHLVIHHPVQVQLVPVDLKAALDVRMLDRFFDNYVMTPLQKIVGDALRAPEERDPKGVADARTLLDTAYRWLEEHLDGRVWAVEGGFSLADCAAAPALFYADWAHPIDDRYGLVKGYRERLLARPSFARAVDEARPYRSYFPLGAPDRD